MVSDGSGASAITGRTIIMTYDSRGQFALAVSNALGYGGNCAYDSKHEVMQARNGSNRLTTCCSQWIWPHSGSDQSNLLIIRDKRMIRCLV